ncbi:hypothetical protein EMIHUDRAFT_229561 [Emiliania huxleyi CCMP1516]|uniref:Lipoyl-binding domain-containing protein n=2 Tax=Emiliania huxleyi TaxID=2903 RepID=A0A0D3KCW9_EMIH1|nr:hypothetical protein EMIHUDRAFT_229561 [Emiliania huxleyi CCMP1516]EOD33604.1 hypothetical protein EMIHUDRAFT_229561 [Emiliania huxleyi CCMP1516]|eukprot:XP_005786033.1 hypothetical protein EMIHUDRAFT_229561 [Emiliania huxleyi CCMP1516]
MMTNPYQHGAKEIREGRSLPDADEFASQMLAPHKLFRQATRRRLYTQLAPRAFSAASRLAAPASLARLDLARTPQPLAAPRRRWLATDGETVEVPVPEMGDSISEGTILSIAKKPGDYVALEETVAEVETDKVTVEVKSPHAGTIKEIHSAVLGIHATFQRPMAVNGEDPTRFILDA